MCGQQAYCFPVPLISIADKVFWSKKNFRILPISLFRAPPHFDIPSYGRSQQFGHWPLAILSSRLMTQITLMTAAILPISPFWQLRDKAVTTVTYNPQRLDLSYMRGDLTHIWGSGAEFFDDTGNSDLRCGPMSSLHQRWTRKYQLGFLSRVSSWPGNIRQQGNIKGFISCQETTKGKYQTAHCYTETTETCIGPQGRPIPTYVCTYMFLHAYTYILQFSVHNGL